MNAVKAIVSVALISVLSVGGATLIDHKGTQKASANPLLPGVGQPSIADVAQGSVGSVVNIFTTKKVASRGAISADPFFNDPRSPFHRGMPDERSAQSLGSGVIVSTQGHILTNSHVVNGANQIRVALSNNKEYDAKVIGVDAMSDLAVIKLSAPPAGLRPMRFGDSSAMRLGEVVLAIGNPFGVGQAVTMGIISAKGRANVGIVRYEDFIQTDAAINPGNSGGALVNMKGELVGINTAILSRTGGYQGIGFAIPSNMSKRIMNSLIANGKVTRGWLGITADTSRKISGITLAAVDPSGPAAAAGLLPGDVITQTNGKAVTSFGAFRNWIAMQGAGTDVRLRLNRSGQALTVKVRLAELNPQIFKRRR